MQFVGVKVRHSHNLQASCAISSVKTTKRCPAAESDTMRQLCAIEEASKLRPKERVRNVRAPPVSSVRSADSGSHAEDVDEGEERAVKKVLREGAAEKRDTSRKAETSRSESKMEVLEESHMLSEVFRGQGVQGKKGCMASERRRYTH